MSKREPVSDPQSTQFNYVLVNRLDVADVAISLAPLRDQLARVVAHFTRAEDFREKDLEVTRQEQECAMSLLLELFTTADSAVNSAESLREAVEAATKEVDHVRQQ